MTLFLDRGKLTKPAPLEATMQSRSENRASPNPQGLGINANLYPYGLGGHAWAPLPKDDMSQALAGLNIGLNANNGKMGVSGMPPGLIQMPVSGGQAPGQFYYTLGNRFVPMNGGSGPEAYQHTNGSSGVMTHGQYVSAAGYGASPALANGSNGFVWAGTPQTSNEPPELTAARRNSFSSNEDTGPHTPFFGGPNGVEYHPRINGTDISPQSWATASPPMGFYPQGAVKNPYLIHDLDTICQQDPPIPRPIPAIFSGDKGRGTLESSLMNKLNTTNVYIRGLHPDTTDEMLWAYGERFGTIDSAKSMMDQQTGTCKGFGFIKYHNFADGSNCIRGFYHWGYEAKWARVSHNEKLKNLADRNNTNLYISGIPTDVDFNEHSLMAIFGEHKCLSSKILRDANGLSRGVGFARFESPEECFKIIDEYNNKPIGQDGSPINVRFADTADQKKLKMETQQRRQFKTHEYNVAAFGPNSPYSQLSPVVAAFSSPLSNRSPVVGGQWPSPGGQMAQLWSTPNGFVSYPSPVIQQNASSMKMAGAENVAPLRQPMRMKADNMQENGNDKVDSPSVAALAKRSVPSGNIQSPVKSTENGLPIGTNGVHNYPEVKLSPVKSVKSSPSKRSPSKAHLLNV